LEGAALVPSGRTYCPYEKEFFPVTEFKIIDDTKIHDVAPPHRATDGVPIEIDKSGKIVEVQTVPQPTPFIVQ
jgi:hypothetical protein